MHSGGFTMKRVFNIVSLSGIAVAILILAYLYWPKATVRAAFDDFPLGQSRYIDFEVNGDALDRMTPREKVDQMRDWLLFTAMSGSGLSAERVNQALYDLPPIREGYLQPVSHFEYGNTRSCYLGDGQVLALLPACSPEERIDKLGLLVDEHRKNTGRRPDYVEVFEYTIDLNEIADEASADLTRRETLDATELFTEKNGYYEARVKSVGELERFLQNIDDLTYAKNESGSLLLGGRKIRGHPYRGVAASDVAAIWQSENKINSASGGVKRQVEGSGFSLDPSFDFDGLKKFFDTTLKPRLQTMLRPSETPAYSLGSGGFPAIRIPGLSSQQQSLDEVSEALGNKEKPDPDPFFRLLGEVETQDPQLAQFISAYTRAKYGFQAARYDGELKGTEAGMTLFYTDLLAKLWALHYLNSAPTQAIADFLPLTAVHVSPIYQKEIESLSSTRLWFGPQDKGFQIVGNNEALFFSRNATRIYAASSEPFKPGVEAPANAASSAFLGWWDDHYEEIARYEPQYERLNQIMKWSLLISWLNKNNEGQSLGYLNGLSVDRGNWFPDWVQKHQKDLKLQQWSKTACSSNANSVTPRPVCFYERGYKKTSTEALPLLYSLPYKKFGKSGVLSGGVSLGSKQVFTGRTALSTETRIGEVLLRSNVDYGASKVLGDAVRTLEGTAYQFRTLASNKALVTAVAKGGTKLRGRFSEFASDVKFETSVAREGANLNVEARAGNVGIGKLNVARTENGFTVGWESRELDAGQSLTRSLSRSPNPAETEGIIKGHTDVETAIRLPGEERYLVKFRGSERWAKIGKDESAFSSVTTEMASPVADIGAPRSYRLGWLRDGEIKTELGTDSFLVVKSGESNEVTASLKIADRRPPSATRPFESGIDGVKVRGQMDPTTGEVYFRFAELPEGVRADPGKLSRVHQKPWGGVDDPYAQAIRRGEYDKAMKDLLNAPMEVKSALRESLNNGVDSVNRLLEHESYDGALKALNSMIEVHGAQPELLLLRGIAKLGKRSPKLGEMTRDVMQKVGTRDANAFYKEMNARLAQQSSGDMTLTWVNEGKRFRLNSELSKFPESVRVSPETINQGEAVVFVDQSLLAQSRAGLNNLDWNVSISQSIHDAVALDLAQLERVTGIGLADFKPSMLYVRASSATTKSGSASKEVAFRPYRIPAPRQSNAGDDEDEKRKKQNNVFILRAKSANSSL
jgi:hypothetical protein